ncbi:MAG: (Fe-S)-binding protein [Dehalococcoidia bacterium]|nr:(Fe-S)-binding protein [Dehalococcoidia bacterium]
MPEFTFHEPRNRVHLFVTCVVDQFFPEVGEAVVRTLRALGDEVHFNTTQTCCGQPAFNSGYWNDAKPLARRFLSQYDGTEPVIMPSGSCAAMVRNYYHELFADDPVNLRRAERLARNVYEFTEYVAEKMDDERLDELFGSGRPDRKVAFHEACHTRRELGVDAQPKALLDRIADRVELPQAEVCCGFGGTFSVKYPDISGAMLSDKLDNIEASGADVVTACDSSCLMHIRGGLRRRGSDVRVTHIAEILVAGLEGRG